LSHGVDDEEDDTFSRPGTAAHTLGELCLIKSEEPWRYIGNHYRPETGEINYYEGGVIEDDMVLVDKEMADAVQLYLDGVRKWHPDRHQGNTWIERQFYCPSIHKYFWGTSDLVYLDGRVLHVWDFKYGAGIVVEVENNPQLKYYACGVLEDLNLWDGVDKVVLHVSQPRGFHWRGPNRDWTIPTGDLIAWLEDELVPGMDRTLVSRDTKSGDHCRFCPARYRACPQLMKDMKELENMLKELEGKTAEVLDNTQIARLLNLIDVAKIVGKAAERTAFARMQAGKVVPGRKLVPAKANRVFKDGAEAEAKKTFGDKAYTEREMKSPAQIEELPGGEAFCQRWAFKPDKGLTLVKGDDNRPAVNKDTKSLFQPVKKRGQAASK